MIDGTTTAGQASFVHEALRYRESGGTRTDVIDYLTRCGCDRPSAEQWADRFDFDLGMNGRPHPHDIDPSVAQLVEAHLAAERDAAALSGSTNIAAIEHHTLPDPTPGYLPPSDHVEPAHDVPPIPVSYAPDTTVPASAPRPGAAVPAPYAEPAPHPAASPHPAAAPHPAATAPAAYAEPAPHPAAAAPAPQPAVAPTAQPASMTTTPTPPPPAAEQFTKTEFGYSIAELEEEDPNEAINSATQMAKEGKSFEQILEHLTEAGVSPDEADYVTAMTGARRRPPEGSVKPKRSSAGRLAAVIPIVALLVGCLLIWVGYGEYRSAGETDATRALAVAAVGVTFALFAPWAMLRSRRLG